MTSHQRGRGFAFGAMRGNKTYNRQTLLTRETREMQTETTLLCNTCHPCHNGVFETTQPELNFYQLMLHYTEVTRNEHTARREIDGLQFPGALSDMHRSLKADGYTSSGKPGRFLRDAFSLVCFIHERI